MLEDFLGVPLSMDEIPITNQVRVLREGLDKFKITTHIDSDVGVYSPEITMFEALTKKLKEQFLPPNASWLARESLRNFKQMVIVRDYVKEFSSLLLDIKNMLDEDKLFNFLAGLRPWAHIGLRRQAVSGKNHKGEDINKKNDKKNANGDAKDNRSLKRLATKGASYVEGHILQDNIPRKRDWMLFMLMKGMRKIMMEMMRLK
ncbi:hypothetical protein AgCh_030643 [Apium graveolens]